MASGFRISAKYSNVEIVISAFRFSALGFLAMSVTAPVIYLLSIGLYMISFADLLFAVMMLFSFLSAAITQLAFAEVIALIASIQEEVRRICGGGIKPPPVNRAAMPILLLAAVLCTGCGANGIGHSAYERARDNYNAEVIAERNIETELEAAKKYVLNLDQIKHYSDTSSTIAKNENDIDEQIAKATKTLECIARMHGAQLVRLRLARERLASFDHEITD